MWEAYCQSHPDAKEFKNQGWPFYDEVKSLMPIELQGKNVCHPGQPPRSREASPDWDLTRGDESGDGDALEPSELGNTTGDPSGSVSEDEEKVFLLLLMHMMLTWDSIAGH